VSWRSRCGEEREWRKCIDVLVVRATPAGESEEIEIESDRMRGSI